jgi:ABC-type multidrug transport system fused ATPase/permease subunit
MRVLSSIGRGVRKAAALPFILVPWRQIKQGRRAIQDQARELWSQSRQDKAGMQQVIRDGDRLIDLRAFAEERGLSEGQARGLLAKRRRETAVAAYACFVFGWLSFFFLLYRVATVPWTSGALVVTLEFSPFSVLFFLMAFKFALDNFRLRKLRHATAGEFLTTNEPFWPG